MSNGLYFVCAGKIVSLLTAEEFFVQEVTLSHEETSLERKEVNEFDVVVIGVKCSFRCDIGKISVKPSYTLTCVQEVFRLISDTSDAKRKYRPELVAVSDGKECSRLFMNDRLMPDRLPF